MNSLHARIRRALESLPERPYWPFPAQGPDFVTNDYLGLVRSGHIQAVLRSAPPDYWQGSTASRYLGGDREPFREVENQVCAMWGRAGERAMFFPSGLTANLAFWSTVPQRSDTIVFDREVHASIRQGIRLSGATAWGFPHNDFSEAEKRLRRARGEVFLVVESLYSMRGTVPDAQAVRALIQRYGCHLVVDEAHTTLILPQGKSWAEQERLEPLARLFTFGKAVGLVGAAWVGPEWLIAYLQRRSFSAIYTTALPPLMAWGIGEVLRRNEEWELARRTLWDLVVAVRELFTQAGLSYEGLEGPIGLIVADTESLSLPLKKLYPPTVYRPAYRLSLHAHNTLSEVEALLAATLPQ